MTDLIQKIMQETGLDEATARKTVDITGSYLKKEDAGSAGRQDG